MFVLAVVIFLDRYLLFGDGEEIIAYLYDKENRSNYVIIDDEEFDYETYFKKAKCIIG